MKGPDIEKIKRKLRGAEMTIETMERLEFDKDGEDGKDVLWLMHVNKNDLPFRVNRTNGRSLAEDLGDDILGWKGSNVAITANKTTKGYGVTIEAIVNDTESDDVPFGGDDEEDDEDFE